MNPRDLPREQLLVFGGESSASRTVAAYNGNTDTWRRLGALELPEPGGAPGDTIHAATCGTRVFIKRSVNCYLRDWRQGGGWQFIGTCEVSLWF